MKWFSLNIISACFFVSCTCQSPTENDVIGAWRNNSGAEFIFYANNKFSAKSIPAEYILLPPEDYKNVQFSGSGNWELRRGSTNWEVYVEFREVSDKRCHSAFPLLLWGKHGILQNKPPWYLFLWKEEEGGERFILSKN